MSMRRPKRKRVWQVGDRVIHKTTGAEAIVLTFERDNFWASKYYCELDTDEDGEREVYGNWGTIAMNWRLKPQTRS